MCGLFGCVGPKAQEVKEIGPAFNILSRGQVSNSYENKNLFLFVHRLPIVDRERAIQPFISGCGRYVVAYNGEVFNYKELISLWGSEYSFSTKSDTEVVLASYILKGKNCVHYLRGQFAFLIVDRATGDFFAARDPLGIVPFYYICTESNFIFSSTVSGLLKMPGKIKRLDGGHYISRSSGVECYFKCEIGEKYQHEQSVISKLRDALEESVRVRVDTDLPVAVIYSGGLDSSVVLDLAVRFHPNVTAFTIGTEGSEDFRYSKRFCEEKGIKQVIVPFSNHDVSLRKIQEAIEACELDEYLDIINAVISIKLFRAIHDAGIKIALCGDGSDELFGGYDMYRRASGGAQDKLFEHKLTALNRTELQRVDRASMYCAVEARVPFLDTKVLELALGIPVNLKSRDGVEKWCVREAFKGILPDYVIARKKNPLSHSSGLHEMVRKFKIIFGYYYRNAGLDRFTPLRRDFSRVLSDARYDVKKAIADDVHAKDYTFIHKLAEFAKASLRLMSRS